MELPLFGVSPSYSTAKAGGSADSTLELWSIDR